VRYVPDLREMIVVGLLEGQLRSDKFDPNQIVPVRENDGFDNELRDSPRNSTVAAAGWAPRRRLPERQGQWQVPADAVL
jgi:hypothetical protein